MNRAVRAAGEHQVDVAAADHAGRRADGLCAGDTGGDAVDVRALGIEQRGEVSRRAVGLVLRFRLGIEDAQRGAQELGCIRAAVGRDVGHGADEAGKILKGFADAEIHAEAQRVDARVGQHGGAGGVQGGAQCKGRLARRIGPRLRIGAGVGERPVAHLRGDADRVAFRIEQRERSDTGAPLRQPLPRLFHSPPQRGDTTEAGDDNATAHGRLGVQG